MWEGYMGNCMIFSTYWRVYNYFKITSSKKRKADGYILSVLAPEPLPHLRLSGEPWGNDIAQVQRPNPQGFACLYFYLCSEQSKKNDTLYSPSKRDAYYNNSCHQKYVKQGVLCLKGKDHLETI